MCLLGPYVKILLFVKVAMSCTFWGGKGECVGMGGLGQGPVMDGSL